MTVATLAELVPHAAAGPGAAGLVDLADELITWAEVEKRVHALALQLRSAGASHGDRIVVLRPKTVDSFVAVHAVLRMGGVMVPLDPLGAAGAHRQVLDSTLPRVLIGTTATISQLAGEWLAENDIRVVTSDDPQPLIDRGVRAQQVQRIAPSPAGCDIEAPVPDDPAYIIFTSGSTGVPKGIVHTHRSALAYATSAVERHRLGPDSRLAATCPLHFDMSTLELYALPLARGTVVSISEGQQRFPVSLVRRIGDTRATHLYAVPFQLRQMVERGGLAEADTAALGFVAFGGEVFPTAEMRALMAAVPTAELHNVYGPAEVNAVVSHRFVEPPAVTAQVLSIGQPWPGVVCRVIDAQGDDVQTGQPGELEVVAPTRMAGYWTGSGPDTRMLRSDSEGRFWYRTGDIVYREPDGLFYFLGRTDHQVKVRGVRLELEPIESAIEDHPQIEAAAVGVSSIDGVDQLVTLIVPTPAGNHLAHEPDFGWFRSWCAQRLMPAAVPTIVKFSSLAPTTATGKIDRRLMRQNLYELVEGDDPVRRRER